MTKDQAKKWFLEGFHESAEGWNGEYPFGLDYPGKDTTDAQLKLDEAFEERWAEAKRTGLY